MSLVEVPEVDVAIWRAIALLVKTQELELDQEEGHLCCLQFAFGFCCVGTKWEPELNSSAAPLGF